MITKIYTKRFYWLSDASGAKLMYWILNKISNQTFGTSSVICSIRHISPGNTRHFMSTIQRYD